MMSRLRTYPAYYWTEKILKIPFTGYVPLPRDHSPLFYYGPVNTSINGNTLEGVRIRAGGMTIAWLHPRLFARGYMAYGFKDQRVKGLAELEYSFSEKKEYANEFPIHSLKFSYYSDVNQYGQNYLYTSKDNVFLALKRKKDDRIGYQQKAELTYRHEYHSGFSYQVIARLRRDESSYLISFISQEENHTYVPSIANSELELKLRYAPGEKFFQTQWNRFPVSLDAPVFSLLVAYDGRQRHIGQRLQLPVHRSRFSEAFLVLGLRLHRRHSESRKGMEQGALPPAHHPQRQPVVHHTARVLQPDERDGVPQRRVRLVGRHLLSERMALQPHPLLKKLQWREVLSCRGMYGRLSDRNNPACSEGLFQFPAGSHLMGSKPYVEVGAGIENILKVLRLDYVWRLTYRDLPGIDRSGQRISLHMTF